MNIFSQVGSAIASSLFVQDELNRAHTFIKQHQLPVPIETNNLHKQLIAMEQYAGSNHFQKGLAKYKLVNILLIIISSIVLLIVAAIAGLEYFSPALGVWDYVIAFLLDQFMLAIVIMGTLFAVVIILSLVRGHYARRLHGKVLNQTWDSIIQYVESK